MVLIRGGEVYSPAPLGRREVLVSGTTIVALLDPSDSLVASLASSDRCVLVAARRCVRVWAAAQHAH